MSVLIRGMEMPKNCYDCPFIRASYAGDYYCAKGNGTEDDLKKIYGQRMDDCPLVKIPTSHGRLIDADKLIEKYGEWYTEEGTESGYIGTMKNLLKDAPTVIEAEGREE